MPRIRQNAAQYQKEDFLRAIRMGQAQTGLMPYAAKNNGLFEIKECFNEKTQWSGTQTLIAPKGRETFRLLIIGI